MGRTGLEPARLTARASKTRMAAITSPAQNFLYQITTNDYRIFPRDVNNYLKEYVIRLENPETV